MVAIEHVFPPKGGSGVNGGAEVRGMASMRFSGFGMCDRLAVCVRSSHR